MIMKYPNPTILVGVYLKQRSTKKYEKTIRGHIYKLRENKGSRETMFFVFCSQLIELANVPVPGGRKGWIGNFH